MHIDVYCTCLQTLQSKQKFFVVSMVTKGQLTMPRRSFNSFLLAAGYGLILPSFRLLAFLKIWAPTPNRSCEIQEVKGAQQGSNVF